MEERLRAVEAFALLNSRILADLISLQISDGTYNRDTVVDLIRFSAEQVSVASPELRSLIDTYSSLTIERMAPAPTKD